MAGSTLSEMDAGTYVDRTGDIVLVFTDTDNKKKSLILQRDTEQPFGSFAHMDDGYYEGDYDPYQPVRLFLKSIKQPDHPSYDIEEIEWDEDHDGAWIGDQGTLIIHRSESDPDRMLHVMFIHDATDELKLALYSFSPILGRFNKTEKFRSIMADEFLTIAPVTRNDPDMSDYMRETFHDKLDDIQKQIYRIGEQIDSALSIAQQAQETADIIASRVSTLEEENKPHSDARDIPDSEGFWRDDDGDIWVRDIEGNTLLIAKGHKEGAQEIYDLPRCSDFEIRACGPYVKIDNPFIKEEDHAN